MIDGVVEFGSRRIGYTVEKTPGKRLRIIVTPRLQVRVRVPAKAGRAEVAAAVQDKAAWIVRQLERQEQFHPLPEPKNFISGETVVYLGRQYRLKVESEPVPVARLVGRFLRVGVPRPEEAQTVRRVVEGWYLERAREVFEKYGTRCFAIGSRHGVPVAKIHIRKMRSRWGACSTKDRVTLNLQLVRAPVHCIEYVIMHEICHLVHHNHSKAFYRLLRRCMPDWEERRTALAEVGVER